MGVRTAQLLGAVVTRYTNSAVVSAGCRQLHESYVTEHATDVRPICIGPREALRISPARQSPEVRSSSGPLPLQVPLMGAAVHPLAHPVKGAVAGTWRALSGLAQ